MEKQGFHRWAWLVMLGLAHRVAFISTVGMIADWLSGYYGFGSLMALLTGIWLMRR